MISVVRRLGAAYPRPADAYAPHVRYPEYRFGTIASVENPAYAMVREVLRQAGLDAEHQETAAWNPLGRWIKPGNKVFILCNFVYHRRPRETEHGLQGKVIHGSVLRALVDYVLIATGEAGEVRFGNAPLQSCRWEDVLAGSGAAAVLAFYQRAGAPVFVHDLRAEVTERDAIGRVTHRDLRTEGVQTVEIDLGRASLLDAIAPSGSGRPRFRVADYNPDRTESFHAQGSHRYVMHRAVLDSDVVVSLPKLKTHEKVGITCAIKGFVGAVARKDCLAHHRFGSPAAGGDEFPTRMGFLTPVSLFHDWLNRRAPDAPAQSLAQIVDLSAHRAMRRLGADSAGAWHGNDTAWRMAVDLARIVHYADVHGVMSETVQRRHLALIDGIVGGEGAGPLSPTAVDSGCLLFSDSVLDADRAASRLMGYDPADLPMIREAASGRSWPIEHPSGPEGVTILDGDTIRSEDLPPSLGRPFAPPRGWRGYLGQKA